MYSALQVDDFVFDAEAVQTAYGTITPEASSTESEYDEQSLRTLLELFCDWGPARTSSLNTSAVDSLDDWTDSEKRDLYQRCCKKIARTLSDQYSYDASEADVRQFAEALTTETQAEAVADFLLNYVWSFSQQLNEFDPETEGVEDVRDFLDALRNLPDECHEVEKQRYSNSDKINGVRERFLQELHDDDQKATISRLEEIKDEENAKFDTNILQNWRNYTIIGQPYFDFFKPRIDTYLTHLAEFVTAELGLSDHEFHTVHFTEPQNYLSDFAWLAIHPGEDGGQRDEYQLYLGVHWNRVTCGLHVGDELRDEGWKTDRDTEQLQDPERVTISTVLGKLRDVKSDYLALNGIDTDDEQPEKPSRADEIARQLRATNQVVFYGPPGTGKTYIAKQFAEWWVHERTESAPVDEQVQTVTFHPSFAYEDFLEGLTASVREGNVTYEVEDGIFKRIADTAQTAYQRATEKGETPPPYVLVVDEINRGDLAQIFGETITQLEADKRLDRPNETTVRLAHSDDPFEVPPNLYLVGTMNTADRSIALVDAALRRRFRFIGFPPAFEEVVDDYDLPENPLVDGDDFESLLGLSVAALRELNDRITQSPDLGKGKQIGHARLFGLDDPRDVRDAWRYDVLPLLEEYYFGQFDRIRQDLFDGSGDDLFDWEREQIRDFSVGDLADALGELVGSNRQSSDSSVTTRS